MSSAFDRAALMGGAALAIALGACDRADLQSTAFAQSTPVPEALGPIPGPQSNTGLASNPFASTDVAVRQGRVYFLRYNCAGCHGDHGGGGMGPSLRDGDWIYGSHDAQVFASIAEGRAHGMPAWGTKLPDEVVWKLVAYIRTLRTDREADPPDQTTPPPPRVP